MTILDELGHALSAPAVALEIIETLGGDDVEITEVTTVRSGNSGARLAKVTLADLSGEPDDRPCVIKYCPPDLASRRPEDPQRKRPESAQHKKALKESPAEFREQHLVESAFPPIRCGGGGFVMGLSRVDGVPLGAVELSQLADVCKQVWEKTLHGWTKHAFARRASTVAELLRWELGDSTQARTWMHDWADERGLLTPALLRLPDENAPLPNPWRMLDVNVPEGRTKIHYLVGRTHGDLHGDNVLVPMFDETFYAEEFRLIDMATYHPEGPLSRDPAALLVSLCSREIGFSSSDSVQEASLAYLEHDRRAARLCDTIPAEIRNVIDALREPTREFAREAGWEADWHKQLKVSLLAEAMLHSAYESSLPKTARWCSRLAGRLTRILLGPVDPRTGPTVDFDAGRKAETSARRAIGTGKKAVTRRRPLKGSAVFVDREPQRSRLRAALEDQLASIIVVSGPPGIGKTALVREVLAELDDDDPEDETSVVRWHDATRYGEIGVQTLIDDIEPPRSGQVAGPSARARLEIALDRLEQAGGERPVIVFDSAENLLTEGHLLHDSQLDLALDAVQSRPRPVVKVVFVTQHPPKATTSVTWTKAAFRLSLDGLELPSLSEYFAKLDPGNGHSLAGLSDDHLRTVHGCLAGNPRLAELLNACLSGEPPALQAHEIVPWLTASTNDVHQRLVRLFVDRLPAEQQRVAEALAALGMPVRTETVTNVVKPYVPAARIEPALSALLGARLVLEREDGSMYLRKDEVDAIFGRLAGSERRAAEGEPPTGLDLVLRVFEALEPMQKDNEDVHGIADLDMHFARLDAWLRAGRYEEAYDLLEEMDELLRRWGSGVELRRQREALQGRLHDDHEGELMNLVFLGDIYSNSGDLPSARSAYTAALATAMGDQDRVVIRQIHINMGSMFWEHDHLKDAERHYRSAFGLAGEDDDHGEDRAAALMGLADCRQRRGAWRGAVEYVLEALGLVRETDLGLASDAALRLARWYAELDQIRDARLMLAECEDFILTRPDPSVGGELLNAISDLDLYEKRYRRALAGAQDAVEAARQHRDPVNLRRSLTTLALTHVHLHDLQAAREAIEESARYRVAGGETVELALRGIIAHRCDLPATARDLFRQLHDETSRRIQADEYDLAAWDFCGLARCHSVLLGYTAPARALDAFSRARPDEPHRPGERCDPTPGLDDRLRFMVETLADGDPRLEPVLIGLARIRPGRTG
ncbi:AAA family ATPase [Actinomadura geliboluensis]|uniref:AAA family ATPase n=1 Tax=Actinomadura geliboluensis TaxID=882440 RepID=UPI00367981DB